MADGVADAVAQRLVDALAATADAASQPASAGIGPPAASDQAGTGESSVPVELEAVREEAAALEAFSHTCQRLRRFPGDVFSVVLERLLALRWTSASWRRTAPQEDILRVLTATRLLLRDTALAKAFVQGGGVAPLADELPTHAQQLMAGEPVPYLLETVAELASVLHKLCAVPECVAALVDARLYVPLPLLLGVHDATVVHIGLHILVRLCHAAAARRGLADLGAVTAVLHVLRDHEARAKRLAMEALRLLAGEAAAKEQLVMFNALPLVIPCIYGDDRTLVVHGVHLLALLADRCGDEILASGGVPVLLSHLAPSVTGVRALPVHIAACEALTRLAQHDAIALQIRECNGVFHLAKKIIRPSSCPPEEPLVRQLQLHAFRALRFLFSIERNRKIFKRLFPPELFGLFIDVGHYRADLAGYSSMVDFVNGLQKAGLASLSSSVRDLDLNKEPTRMVRDYGLLEKLGQGAFGCVYRVRKQGGQTFQAMKQIPLENQLLFGQEEAEKTARIGTVLNEVKIIESQLRHPNIVRYQKSFCEEGCLFIVMEMVEGASLQEHFNALTEKKEKMVEDRIWNIFIQMARGLRYIHKDKRVVHRDLTPSNVMLGWNDTVKITDFGLARQRNTGATLMESSVGTPTYSCPEVITNQPYGESADIWAAGCILYQMVTLVPPFNSTNMLALARTIVEGTYPALPEESCSEILRRTVAACLTPDPKKRPDIEQVCGIIAPLLLRELDACNAIVARRDRELEKERKRRQRHVMEASRNMEQYYRLFNASQDPGLGGNPSTPTSGTQSPLKLSFRDTLPSLPEDGPGAEVHRRRPASVASSRPASATHGRSVPPSPMVGVVGPLDGSGRWRGGRALTTHGSSSSQDSVFQSDASPEAGAEGAPVPPSPSKHASRGASSARLRSSRGSTAGGRPTAGSIAIAPSKVRQISDPASQLLNQLHKIIYVTQLPPDSAPNVARHVIELYKRALFSRRNKSLSLKMELHKMVTGSKDLIDIDFGLGAGDLPLAASGPHAGGAADTFERDAGDYDMESISKHSLTYEHLRRLVERALTQAGYYDLPQPKTESTVA